jgi:uncharacterized protein YkwD
MNRRRVIKLLLVLACAWCVSTLGSEDVLTSEERKQVSELIAQFRKTRDEPQRRDEVVDRLTEFGEPAVLQLMSVIGKEVDGRLKRYGPLFQQRAAELSRSRVAQMNMAALAETQARILSLKKQGNLSKAMIVKQADPAMAKLRQALVVDRNEVLKAFPDLQTQRQELSAIGRYWERCAGYLLEQMPKVDGDDREPPSFEEYLRGEERLSAHLASPMDARTRSTLATNARLATRLDREEARAILACNLTRNLLGLRPLAIDARLCAAARDHSADMRRLKFFSHTSPVAGKKTPWDRAKRFATKASAENIFAGPRDGVRANKAWFHSPGHLKNMLGKHRRIGVGRSGGYFTQMFGG